MHASHAPNSILRFADSPSSSQCGAVAAAWDRVEADFGGQPPEPAPDFSSGGVDPFPAWLAGGIIVGLSSVFWVGLLTVVSWII